MQLTEIQKLTELFATEHRHLTHIVQTIEAEIAGVRKRCLKKIMDQVALTAARKAKLIAALEESKDLFKKPRTRTFDGVKVGYQKQKGEIVIEDEAATIAKLQKILGDDEAASYLNVKVTVKKTAVSGMPAELMKKVGITLEADTDAIVVKPLDSDIEKIVAALLEQQTEETKEAA